MVKSKKNLIIGKYIKKEGNFKGHLAEDQRSDVL